MLRCFRKTESQTVPWPGSVVPVVPVHSAVSSDPRGCNPWFMGLTTQKPSSVQFNFAMKYYHDPSPGAFLSRSLFGTLFGQSSRVWTAQSFAQNTELHFFERLHNKCIFIRFHPSPCNAPDEAAGVWAGCGATTASEKHEDLSRSCYLVP